MNNRKEIMIIYIEEFETFLKVKKLLNKQFYLDQESIIESIKLTEERYRESIDDIALSEKERKTIVDKIESLYNIYQEEGYAILGSYDHDFDWYKKFLISKDHDEYYWERYKKHLKNDKYISGKVLDVLENKTLKSIMSYLGNPKDDGLFSIRGLVMGDIQSGKTSNYVGLITKAVDAGYKVVFVLTGTIESLRKQTQQRIEEGFIGFDSTSGVDVGVGRGEKTPKAFTSRGKDFTSGNDQNTTYKISDYSTEPIIFIVKKNVSVLRKMFSALKRINTTNKYEKINYSMLMIDDEADNASINTNEKNEDPTQTNKYIRDILSLFTRTSYVGFTATPFANVFINYDSNDEMLENDLFPRDFIYALNPPSNYCGPEKYFFKKNDNVKYITDDDQEIFPISHNKEWEGDYLYESVYHSINTFLVSNAIRDIRDSNHKTHRSMLINISRFKKVHGKVKNIVEGYLSTVKMTVKQTHKLDKEYSLTNKIISSLKKSYEDEYKKIRDDNGQITWDKIFEKLYDSIKDIKVVVINSSRNSEKLNYENYIRDGLRVIAIGGLALSRGLTLEGLCVSYFYRQTSTFDVLMQMGRWFGYREGYEDLCRIYLTEQTEDYYKEIYRGMEELKNDIKTMCDQGKRPEEYGVRVRNASIKLRITAPNKMRNTKNKIVRQSFYGNIFETPYLHRDLTIIEQNIEETMSFLENIDALQKDKKIRHPYFRGINKNLIINYLQNLRIHEANESFDIKQLISFLSRKDEELDLFDVLVIGGASKLYFNFDALDIHINLIERKFDIKRNEVIRINRDKAHLWGRSDAIYGLSEEEIDKNGINKNKSKAQEYLIEGRNPLLIIYFIDLKSEKPESIENIKLINEINQKEYNFVIGFAIGFPNKGGEASIPILYTVNNTVNYYDKNHGEDIGDKDYE